MTPLKKPKTGKRGTAKTAETQQTHPLTLVSSVLAVGHLRIFGFSGRASNLVSAVSAVGHLDETGCGLASTVGTGHDVRSGMDPFLPGYLRHADVQP